jgi:hypothetical protein
MNRLTDEALNALIKYTKRQLSFEKNVLEDQESSETTLIVSPRTTYLKGITRSITAFYRKYDSFT